jgi:hypothetical protein
VWECRTAEVLTGLIGRIVYVISTCAATIVIAPDVIEIEPVAYLVSSSAAFIIGRSDSACIAKGGIVDHHAVSSCSPSREMRVTQQATAEIANPKIEIRG